MNRVGKVFGCLLPTLVGYACQFAVAIGASMIYTTIITVLAVVKGITEEAELSDFFTEKLLNANYLLAVTAVATFVTLVIGVFWYKRQRPETDFGLKEVVSNKKLVFAMFLLGIALQILISMCLNLIFPVLPQTMTEEYAELLDGLLGGNIWLSLLVTVVLAPIAEELLFRGVTLKKAQKLMSFTAANVVQAVLFGIYHGNLIQGTYAFVLGMILGFTAEYFHSVWASILLHAFVNGSAELLNLLPVEIIGSLPGMIAMILLGAGLVYAAVKLCPTARREPEKTGIKFSENSFDE